MLDALLQRKDPPYILAQPSHHRLDVGRMEEKLIDSTDHAVTIAQLAHQRPSERKVESQGNRGCPIHLAVLFQPADVLKVKRLPVEGGVMRIDRDTEIADRLGSIDDQHPDQSQEDRDSG
jgi:hypothetical protein